MIVETLLHFWNNDILGSVGCIVSTPISMMCSCTDTDDLNQMRIIRLNLNQNQQSLLNI